MKANLVPPESYGGQPEPPVPMYDVFRSIGGIAPEVEEAQIRGYLNRHESLRQVELVRIGESGYVLLNLEHQAATATEQAQGTRPGLFVDVDDVTHKFSMSKDNRGERFAHLFAQLTGLSGGEATRTAHELMKATNDFARWEDGKRTLYHDLAHELTLGWAVSQVKAAGPGRLDAALNRIKDVLGRVKQGDQTAAPFRFKGSTLVCDNPEAYVTGELMEVFEITRAPKRSLEVISALQRLQREGVAIDVFTHGVPMFQIRKVLEERRRLNYGESRSPFRHLLVTTDLKGTFLSDLFAAAQTDPRLKEAFFSDEPHVLALFDDSPEELASFNEARDEIEARSGARLAAIPSLQPGTKNVGRWGKTSRQALKNIRNQGHHQPYVHTFLGVGPEAALYGALSTVAAQAAQEPGITEAARTSLETQAAAFGEQAADFEAWEAELSGQARPHRRYRWLGRAGVRS